MTLRTALAMAAALWLLCAPSSGQPVYGPSPEPPTAPAAQAVEATAAELLMGDRPNPVGALEAAARALPGAGDGREGFSTALNILILMTVLSLAPAIMVMTTSFVRIVIVLALLKQALGTQTLPPSQVVIGLALFMTLFIMGPTFDRVYGEAIAPYQRGEITDQLEMWDRAQAPLRDFMFAQIEATGNWSALYMLLEHRGIDVSEPSALTRADVPTTALIPAFMLSELKTAFLMGFRVYLPFLVIDMVISSLLISMSMMMLPPVLISLPFKILLFVLVDGWTLIVGSLMRSFAQPDVVGAVSAAAGLLV